MSDVKTPDPTPDPRADEATGKDVSVEWKGKTYTIPRDYADWPYAYTLEAERGHPAAALAHLLGPTQHARFMQTGPTNRDFDEFDQLLGKALGLGQGESQASSD